MAEGIAIRGSGHTTWLKWHRGRKQAGDPAFTGTRILEGMRLGASVEVDLLGHASGGFAILHDAQLDRETSGTGNVAGHTAEALRALRLRNEAGEVLEHPVMLLEDLCALLQAGPIHADALLQLDLKNDNAELTEATVTAFAAAVGPVAGHMILSGGDAEAITRLRADAPGLGVGYDPCYAESMRALLRSREYAGFVAEACAAVPDAGMIYLYHPLIAAASDAGFDLIGAFHAAGKRIDAYTLEVTAPDTVARARRLIELRVDQITTDDPVGLEMALAGHR